MKTKLLALLLLTFAANAFAALDTPTEDFIDNNDGTVTHKKTGLTWQRCSVGQTWMGSSCNGTALNLTYDQAIIQGDSNWKLPRIDELTTIVEYNAVNPSINNSIFPNTLGFFWAQGNKVVNFDEGGSSVWSQLSNLTYKVRLVYNNQITGYFVDNGNGTVTDKKTGLMWQRCSVGQTWTGSVCDGSIWYTSFSNAVTARNDIAGYYDWRLPSIAELTTIIDYTGSDPTINKDIFRNMDRQSFFSSTIYAGNPNGIWVVNFASGSVTRDSYGGIRLVRGTWSAPPSTPIYTPVSPSVAPTTIDLSSTLSQSSSRVKINENLTYTATVINNGTGTANNSSLKIYLPPRNVSVVSMPSDCMTTGKSITCSLGNLAAGANASRVVTVSYTKSGGASVSALVLTDSEDTNSANNVSRVVTAIKK